MPLYASMFFAKLLVAAGLFLLAVGLLRKKAERDAMDWKIVRQTDPLFKDEPGDLKDTIYHPKEWRKPK